MLESPRLWTSRTNTLTAALVASLSLYLCDGCGGLSAQEQSSRDVQQRQLTLPWTSTNTHPDGVSRQIADLYVLLYNTQSLPVRQYTSQSARTISDLAYEQGFFSGSYFPMGIDAVLCDLNPHVCSRELVEFADDGFAHLTDHVGGYEITQGRWKYAPGVPVTVVDLQLEGALQFTPRVIPPGRSIGDLLKVEGYDCSTYSMSCDQLVRALNPGLKDLSIPSDGKLAAILPTRRVSTQIPLKQEDAAGELVERYETQQLPQSVGTVSEVEFRGAQPQNAPPREIATRRLESLKENLYLKRSDVGKADSGFDNIHAGNLTLFEQTGHPYRTRLGNLTDLVHTTINVGVIDNWLDAEHCHFVGKVQLLRPLEPREDLLRGVCYDDGSGGLASHGTHIVGAITGGADQAKFIGLYPQAQVVFAAANIEALGGLPTNQLVSADLHQMALGRQVRVMNLSWEYQKLGDNDPVLAAIRGLVQTSLFVVSAGNSGRSLDHDDTGCIWDPACLGNEPNVISVVGLTANLNDPKVYGMGAAGGGSNYGTAFHIAAVGQDVLSTVNGGGVGAMSGTSQAAPQVTAGAGLLNAIFKERRTGEDPPFPHPSKVKNRLMYTADIFPQLLDSVFSGRINIARALAINDTQVVFDQERDMTLRVRVLQHPGIIVCGVGEEAVSISWDKVRRLTENTLSSSMVVFYEEPVVKPEGTHWRLKRIPNCDLQTQTNAFEVQEATGRQIARQLKDIVDYTNRM